MQNKLLYEEQQGKEYFKRFSSRNTIQKWTKTEPTFCTAKIKQQIALLR
jgi:hypothetical protein